MGHYTEIYVNVDLKQDTPADVIEILRAMCGGEDKSPLDGKPERWDRIFSSGSYYTPNTSVANLTFDEISGRWSLLGKGDIKNYEGEIEAFFEWLSPHIEGQPGDFIGYSRPEHRQEPALVLLPNTR